MRFFCQCQQVVQKTVNKAKEDWIQKVVSDAEAAVKGGKVKWNNIHRLRVYGGRRLVQPTSVFKDNGELTKGPSEVSDRWFQHFEKVLNIQSIYDENVLDTFPSSPPLIHLDDPPTMAELEDAMTRLKARKAGGLSGILPELVLCGKPVLHLF